MRNIICRIHVVGSLKRNKEHPETRAVMFDDQVYSKRKIVDFVATIESFERVNRMIRGIAKFFRQSQSVWKNSEHRPCFLIHSLSDFRSSVLKIIFTTEAEGGAFPDLKKALEYFSVSSIVIFLSHTRSF